MAGRGAHIEDAFYSVALQVAAREEVEGCALLVGADGEVADGGGQGGVAHENLDCGSGVPRTVTMKASTQFNPVTGEVMPRCHLPPQPPCHASPWLRF